TTKAAVYLAIKHIFPDVPINAGCFEPLHIADPHKTFLYARYPSPVSGCAAEVSARIAESVFTTLARAIPDDLFAAPAGTSGNLTLGGYDPLKERHYIRYVFSGGGDGAHLDTDGLADRDLEDTADGCAGAALSLALRAVRAARAVGRRRKDARRVRRRLSRPHLPRRGAAVVPDGPRARRSSRSVRRSRRRAQRGGPGAGRAHVHIAPLVEGRRHPREGGRSDHGAHAGRRRLRCSARP